MQAEEADLRLCRIRAVLVSGVVLRQTVKSRGECFLDLCKIRALCSDSKVVCTQKAASAPGE